MSRSNIYQVDIIKQDAKVGIVTKKGLSLTRLIENLIREHGQYCRGSYSVDVESFPISDKRLLISHFESAEWYEYACQSHLHTETIFADSKKYIQSLIDDSCSEVYRDDMEQMRAYK